MVQYRQNSNHDAMINSHALPILDQEVVQQQSASIDTISGATVTTDGYLQSLQLAMATLLAPGDRRAPNSFTLNSFGHADSTRHQPTDAHSC